MGVFIPGCRRTADELLGPLLDEAAKQPTVESRVEKNVKGFLEQMLPGQTVFTWSSTWRDYYLTRFQQAVGAYHYYLKLKSGGTLTFSFKAMAQQSFNPATQGLQLRRNGVIVYQYAPKTWQPGQ
ncbi:MAG: hypothetical protein Q8P77_00840 [Candidatus Veblenbacteria bacterium]|nr:hypothetical protein [Candidatus Veblenbacteria bacterium]